MDTQKFRISKKSTNDEFSNNKDFPTASQFPIDSQNSNFHINKYQRKESITVFNNALLNHQNEAINCTLIDDQRKLEIKKEPKSPNFKTNEMLSSSTSYQDPKEYQEFYQKHILKKSESQISSSEFKENEARDFFNEIVREFQEDLKETKCVKQTHEFNFEKVKKEKKPIKALKTNLGYSINFKKPNLLTKKLSKKNCGNGTKSTSKQFMIKNANNNPYLKSLVDLHVKNETKIVSVERKLSFCNEVNESEKNKLLNFEFQHQFGQFKDDSVLEKHNDEKQCVNDTRNNDVCLLNYLEVPIKSRNSVMYQVQYETDDKIKIEEATKREIIGKKFMTKTYYKMHCSEDKQIETNNDIKNRWICQNKNTITYHNCNKLHDASNRDKFLNPINEQINFYNLENESQFTLKSIHSKSSSHDSNSNSCENENETDFKSNNKNEIAASTQNNKHDENNSKQQKSVTKNHDHDKKFNYSYEHSISNERRPDLPDEMPIELVEELETMKNNEFNIINQNSLSKEHENAYGNLINKDLIIDKQSHNTYREEYSPVN